MKVNPRMSKSESEYQHCAAFALGAIEGFIQGLEEHKGATVEADAVTAAIVHEQERVDGECPALLVMVEKKQRKARQ